MSGSGSTVRHGSIADSEVAAVQIGHPSGLSASNCIMTNFIFFFIWTYMQSH